MKKLSERLALILLSAVIMLFMTILAFGSGNSVTIGMALMAIAMISFVSVLATVEVMQTW
jgi:multisubunit Na+/H+ antiporter MnhF subunit